MPPEDVLLGAERAARRPTRLAEVVVWFTTVAAVALVTLLAFWLLLALLGGR